VRYQNGRAVSPRVFQAIRYMTKVGTMTRTTWNQLFSNGTPRWKQKQLRLLVDGNVFATHPHRSVRDVYVIGQYGLKMIQKMGWQDVYYVEPKYFEHDEAIAKGVWILEQNKICTKWLTERELRSQKSKNFKLQGLDGGPKYPDAVMRLDSNTGSKVIALEYEKTIKSSMRYNKIIRAYSDANEFDYVICIVENEATEKCIRRSQRYIGDALLNSKMGFIFIHEWIKNPALATIRGLGQIKNFSEITKN
jgi:hypothetical protein